MRSNVAYLITYAYTKNNYGVLERTQSKRKVYVDVINVNSQEFFEGGRNGLKPIYRFSLFEFDYKGEEVIEFENKQYTIYRTYKNRYDQIDLYVELKKGNEQEIHQG